MITKNKRPGRFKISFRLVDEMPWVVKTIMPQCDIVRVEALYMQGVIEYEIAEKIMRKRKVVHNACIGSFNLSDEACSLGQSISGDSNWDYSEIPRHDPVLIEVVERLGSKASGENAKLEIAEVSGKYRIDEYDGAESVKTPDSYDWVE
jgi:hypothetical protein